SSVSIFSALSFLAASAGASAAGTADSIFSALIFLAAAASAGRCTSCGSSGSVWLLSALTAGCAVG
ncbi:hypothetical protein PENTCL1PPCAC_232, partial [Pristionchus entomophagus]